jgi:hypothetical protein
MRPRRAAIALAVTAGLAATAVAGARTESTVIATAKNTKGQIAVAVGSAKAPVHRLTFTVKPTAPQRVSIAWSLSCQTGATKGNGPGANTPTATSGGTFKANAPFTQDVKLPSAHTLGCSISVYSTLSKPGKETVQILEN